MLTNTSQSKPPKPLKRFRLAMLAVLVSMLIAPATLWGGPFNNDVPKFLPAEQAFIMSATYDGGDSVRLVWYIAAKYYLYDHRFSVHMDDGRSIAHTAITTPLAKTDPYFGEVKAYYDRAVLVVNLDAAPLGKALILDVKYQGCAEAGICYPPDQRQIQLTPGSPGVTIQTLPDLSRPNLLAQLKGTGTARTSSPASPAAPELQNTADRLFGLLVDGNIFIILALFFIAGVGLALTPCVLPMVPILASIVIGSSKPGTKRAAALSVSYVLGMAVVYASLGALMGLFGASVNIQAALQQPWLLSVFAALFVALALSMFGFYELRLPSAWQNHIDALVRRQSGGLRNSMIVGALSALIVSPCISAPLAGALVYIGTHQDATLGAAALFSLALGMGAPLILFGTGAGALVPHAGLWMEQVKIAAGIMLLGLAVWLLERWLAPFAAALLWGALAIGVAAWLSRINTTNIWPLAAWRLLALAAFIYGIVVVSDATINRTVTTPSERIGFIQLDNLENINRTLASLDRPALLYFSADWCVSCRIIENQVFTDPDITAAFPDFKLIKADVTDNTYDHSQLLEHFGLFGPPALLLFDRTGVEQRSLRLQGEFTTPDLQSRLAVLATTSR